MNLVNRARTRVVSKFLKGSLEGLSRVARLHPRANLARHHVEIIRDIPYFDDGDSVHTLDIYRSTRFEGPRPTILYIHGGAFRILSKDSHWIMGLIFAKYGYTVFNINYRLAPRHKYPAAIEDACRACTWVLEHAAEYGADPQHIVFAGESAGGNLATALALAACSPRPEPWAKAVWEADPNPRAVIAACAVLQVSDMERFGRQRKLPSWLMDHLLLISRSYLPDQTHPPGFLDLADPLVIFERGDALERPLPPFFTFVGTKDPLLDDTIRLERALERLEVPCEARFYGGEPHAFHAFVWKKNARLCWRHQLEFLGRHIGSSSNECPQPKSSA